MDEEEPGRLWAEEARDDDAPADGKQTGRDGLSALEVAVLEFAALRWKYAGARESAILDRFGWSPTRYHQVLTTLLDHPAAVTHCPQLVARLRRLRDARRSQRQP